MNEKNSSILKAKNFVEVNKKLSKLDITLITNSKTRTYLIRAKRIWNFFYCVYIVLEFVLLFVGNWVWIKVITTAYCQRFLTDAWFYLLHGQSIEAIYLFVFTVVFIVFLISILTYFLVLFFIRKFLFSFYMFLLKEKKKKKKEKRNRRRQMSSGVL